MCGIFSLFLKTKHFERSEIYEMFQTIQHRGPDDSQMLFINDQTFIGFHRLSINDLSTNGKQPFVLDNVILTCNGEIYNYKKICKKYNITLSSNSDCEVIVHLYNMFGIRKTIDELRGVFAFSLYDQKSNVKYIARDRLGIRPVFYQIDEDLNFVFSSEAKSLVNCNISETHQLKCGHYMEVNDDNYGFTSYFTFNPIDNNISEYDFIANLYHKLHEAVKIRLLSDRPIACLLSGGLDSSIIACILANIYQKYNKQIHTFTIGFPESTDLLNAKIVADHINSIHHEYIITPEYAISRIPDVIKMIETYDITTIRASTMMYLICEYISTEFNFKVIFSGEGADELLGGYLYFHYAPSDRDFENETLRITKDLQYFDVLRGDRCTAGHGLELRVPFLDQDFVQYCHSVPGRLRRPFQNIEKYYLRKAFEDILPDQVLWRKKEALSDGVSGLTKSWFEYIQEWATNYFEKNNISGKDFKDLKQVADFCNIDHFLSQESLYFYQQYRLNYNHDPIPYYWLPRWQNTQEPSARTLSVFE